jgi:hypothetical protein
MSSVYRDEECNGAAVNMYVPLETLKMCRMNRIASDLVILSTFLDLHIPRGPTTEGDHPMYRLHRQLDMTLKTH